MNNGFGAEIDLSGNAIVQTVKEYADNAASNSETRVTQNFNQWSVEVVKTFATQSEVDALSGYIDQEKKYMTFDENYLIIGNSNNQFNVQITNDSINFRHGTKTLAYMNGDKFYIKEGEITDQLRIGNYLWMLPGADNAVALIYQPKGVS